MVEVRIIKIENKEYVVVSWQKDGILHSKLEPKKESLEEGEQFFGGHVIEWQLNHIDCYFKEKGKIKKTLKPLSRAGTRVMPLSEVVKSGGVGIPAHSYIGIAGNNLPEMSIVGGTIYAASNNPFDGSLWLAHDM
jgi:hypothetical protein